MKILVSGCSISQGYGFPLTINDPSIWPNLIAKELDGTVTNVSVPGYDNTGIFLNALKELTTDNYDLILIQITSLDRIVVSPTMHCTLNLMGLGPNSLSDNKTEQDRFFKLFLKINQQFEHWKRLMNIIISVQNLVKQGYNIKLINGLLHWNKEFFSTDNSKFAKELIDFHNLPDEDIEKGLVKINRDKALIDSKIWINLINSFGQMQVDNASLIDNHPGPESHKIYSKLILDNLKLETK